MKLHYFIFTLLLSTLLSSCRVQLVNAALQSVGVFEDSVRLTKFKKDNSEIVFMPMHHAGTEAFYNDVANKVDSLERLGHFVYWEKIKFEKRDSLSNDTIARKFRKITGIYSFKNDFRGTLDSLLKNKFHKLRKPLINQPKYKDLGVDSLLSKNVDASIEQMIAYHNDNYGIVKLESCDFITKITEKSKCEKPENHKEISDYLMINFRNNIVLNEISNETRNKITIIYGEGHLKGIKEGLLERGYTQVEPPQ